MSLFHSQLCPSLCTCVSKPHSSPGPFSCGPLLLPLSWPCPPWWGEEMALSVDLAQPLSQAGPVLLNWSRGWRAPFSVILAPPHSIPCMYAKALQLCPTLCDPMDSSPPGSSVHGTLQARILERVAIPFSMRSSQPNDRTRVSYVSCIGRQVLYHQCHLGSPLSPHQTSGMVPQLYYQHLIQGLTHRRDSKNRKEKMY